MIVELVFTLKEDENPYGEPFSSIVAEVDERVHPHSDSGTSFLEPRERDICWHAEDLTEVDLLVNTIKSVLDSQGSNIKAEVRVRTSIDMLESPIWKESHD